MTRQIMVTFETEGDLDAALEALEEASQENYIEHPFNVHKLDTNKEETTDVNWT